MEIWRSGILSLFCVFSLSMLALKREQQNLYYEFYIEEVVKSDHPQGEVSAQSNGTRRSLREEKRMEGEGSRVLEEKGIESLPFGGKRLVKESNGERIERFVERLVASGKSLPPSPSKKPTTTSAQTLSTTNPPPRP